MAAPRPPRFARAEEHAASESATRMSFEMHDAPVGFANSLRRIVLAEVPSAAFAFDAYDSEKSGIKILANTAPVHNEMLGSRISLVPVKFSAAEINPTTLAEYSFVLKMKNATPEDMPVTTEDFEVLKNGVAVSDAERRRLLPPDPITGDYILLTVLKANTNNPAAGDEVHVEAVASLGIAKTHACWCTVSQCSMYYKVDDAAADAALALRKKALSGASITESQIESDFNTLERFRHWKKNQFGEPAEIVFRIESECGMTPRQIFSSALAVLKQRFATMSIRLDPEIVPLEAAEGVPADTLFEVRMDDITHTYMDPLYNFIFDTQLRTPGGDLVYVGYHQPHPLKETMVVKMRFKTAKTADQVRDQLRESCRAASAYTGQIADSWTAWSSSSSRTEKTEKTEKTTTSSSRRSK